MSAQKLVPTRSRNGAPSRKGCVVSGRRTQASNKNEYAHPLSPPRDGTCLRFYREKNSAFSSLVGLHMEGCVCPELLVSITTSRNIITIWIKY